ncbi:radical SAM protein [Rhodobacter maris]|uniref:MoaA/NifB/PqqE/SkfB family radical SAM enzyme n=1 Tax=Rhodobacter maris TaxID=446682 RepID=A0A285S898_9RHOB|nr:radical SAM protein [Rhodobacter maris]SOC03435.1 MoaA/NifB/PqqE/SkfB family radical SAM enzyme [Rhodobacter maris]
MSTAVLLYTMRCNIACAHCSVHSGPGRRGEMDLERARAYVDQLAAMPEIRFIDISGGEPMLHPQEVTALIEHIKRRGKSVRLTTNGFWAATPRRAEEMLRHLKAAGLDAVGLSLDKWHLDYLPASIARNYVDAARVVGFAPLVSCVVRGDCADPRAGAPEDLRVLLDFYGLGEERATDLNDWGRYMDSLAPEARAEFLAETIRERLLVNWQYLTGEGRAAEKLHKEVVWRPLSATPEERCSVAGRMPTVDQDGRLFPCCAPWVNHPERAYAAPPGRLGQAIHEMEARPALRVIRQWGPKRLMLALIARGHSFPRDNSGICNLCGQMLATADLEELDRAAEDVLRAQTAGREVMAEI